MEGNKDAATADHLQANSRYLAIMLTPLTSVRSVLITQNKYAYQVGSEFLSPYFLWFGDTKYWN